MNLFSTIAWTLRALRGYSVTWAVVLASALLGVPLVRLLRQSLDAAGMGWWGTLLVPVALIGYCARHEQVWIPNEARRRRWAWGIVIAAILVAGVLARFGAERAPDDETKRTSPAPREQPLRSHGPPGK